MSGECPRHSGKKCKDFSSFHVEPLLTLTLADRYWPRYPTGREFVAEVVVTLLHGGRGALPCYTPMDGLYF
jgi:hypothetical protein